MAGSNTSTLTAFPTQYSLAKPRAQAPQAGGSMGYQSSLKDMLAKPSPVFRPQAPSNQPQQARPVNQPQQARPVALQGAGMGQLAGASRVDPSPTPFPQVSAPQRMTFSSPSEEVQAITNFRRNGFQSPPLPVQPQVSPSLAPQLTAPQQAVQSTPIGFGQTAAQQQGVGQPVAQRTVNINDIRKRPDGTPYLNGDGTISENTGSTDTSGNQLTRKVRPGDTIVDDSGNTYTLNQETGQLDPVAAQPADNNTTQEPVDADGDGWPDWLNQIDQMNQDNLFSGGTQGDAAGAAQAPMTDAQQQLSDMQTPEERIKAWEERQRQALAMESLRNLLGGAMGAQRAGGYTTAAQGALSQAFNNALLSQMDKYTDDELARLQTIASLELQQAQKETEYFQSLTGTGKKIYIAQREVDSLESEIARDYTGKYVDESGNLIAGSGYENDKAFMAKLNALNAANQEVNELETAADEEEKPDTSSTEGDLYVQSIGQDGLPSNEKWNDPAVGDALLEDFNDQMKWIVTQNGFRDEDAGANFFAQTVGKLIHEATVNNNGTAADMLRALGITPGATLTPDQLREKGYWYIGDVLDQGGTDLSPTDEQVEQYRQDWGDADFWAYLDSVQPTGKDYGDSADSGV